MPKSNYEFKFPDVGEGIHEGVIVKWNVKEGQLVETDQPLGEVETDKAVVEIPSPKKGKVLKLNVKEGGVIKVGETMVTLEVEGKVEQKTGAEQAGGVVGFLPESEDQLFKKSEKVEKKAEQRGNVAATPAVRKLASDLGVDISKLKGTGFNGMITQDDVVKASTGNKPTVKAPQPQQPKIVKKYDFWGYVDHMPLKGMRKTISEHMEAAHQIPSVTHMDEFDATALFELREKEKVKAKAQGIHLTYLSYIVKAAVLALQKHPLLNATLDKDNEDVVLKKYYNIGIAVDTPEGLMVPVVKGADKKEVYMIASEIEKFAAHAQDRKIDLADLKGGTFTITNIGSIGGTSFTPIINAPEVAILGVCKLEEKALVKDGKVVVRKVMPLVLAFDHRIVDGAEAARFMNDVIAMLEKPEQIK